MTASTSNPPYTPDQLTLLRDLFAAGCVLVGDEVARRFGLHSPIYINMRENLYARPELLSRVGGEFAWKIVELATPPPPPAAALAAASIADSMGVPANSGLTSSASPSAPAPQVVVGIPDTATPLALATAMFSWGNRTTPRITFALLRKEAKRYPGQEPRYWLGHRETPFAPPSAFPTAPPPPADPSRASQGAPPRHADSESSPAQNAEASALSTPREYNLIDDVVASGLTKRAAAEKMRAEGIPLTRIIVLFDRGQGDGLREEGYPLHSIFSLRAAVDFYASENLITPADHTRISEFLSTHRFDRRTV